VEWAKGCLVNPGVIVAFKRKNAFSKQNDGQEKIIHGMEPILAPASRINYCADMGIGAGFSSLSFLPDKRHPPRDSVAGWRATPDHQPMV